jgi:hypothetical protein
MSGLRGRRRGGSCLAIWAGKSAGLPGLIIKMAVTVNADIDLNMVPVQDSGT